VDGVEQLSHHGNIGLQGLLAAGQEVLVVGSDMRFSSGADHGWEEQSPTQVGVSDAGDACRPGDRRAGLVLTRIESGMGHPLPRGHVLGKGGELGEDVESAGLGDAPDRLKEFEATSEDGVLADQGTGDLLQVSKAAIQLLDVLQDVLAYDRADLPTAVNHVQAVLLSSPGPGENLNAPCDGADLQDAQGGRTPGREGHASGKLEKDLGIDGVRFGALQPGAGEIPNGSRVGDLDLDSRSSVQRPSELEPVDPRGLHANARRNLPGGDPADEPAMAARRIGDFEHPGGSARMLECNGKGLGSHIDPYENGFHALSLRVYDRFRLPDPGPLPTGLVMQAHQPQKLSGMGKEGGGPI